MKWKEIDKIMKTKQVNRDIVKWRNMRCTRRTVVYRFRNCLENEFYYELGCAELRFHGWDATKDHEYIDIPIKDLQTLENIYQHFIGKEHSWSRKDNEN
ncbi:hypothetical protein SAMN05720764_11428 [Fibrobacter sp. UWH5]|nr:hypothetical protein SAMN05720764_11428 [Fibrobacter sp. UWH5]